MKTLFIFSDIHSFYDEFRKALLAAGFDDQNEDHILVSLGDLCDRGDQSRQVLSFINSFPESRKICIMGNHEMLMEELIKAGHPSLIDELNGTMKTAIAISEEGDDLQSLRHNRYWSGYKKSWRLYYETDSYIFVHGWIPFHHSYNWGRPDTFTYDPDWRNRPFKDFCDAAWENGMEAWSKGIREPGKTIFCGHWHTSWGHALLHGEGVEYPDEKHPEKIAYHTPFIDEGIIALDACTALSRQVNVHAVQISDDDWERSRQDERIKDMPK